MTVTEAPRLALYRTMVLIRRFEEATIDLYKEGLIGGSLHTYVGQEAVSAGCCAAMREDDQVNMTYRGRGVMLAKGGDPNRTLAEMLARRTGYCKGKGGPMHLLDMERGILMANGIVAGGVPIAVGAALSAKLLQSGRVVATFFGEGAVNEGAWHEAVNLAAIWDLPIVFVCENNLYSEMTPIKRMVRVDRIADRATAYGIPGVRIDGNDAEAVYATMAEAVGRARAGGGPTLIEAMTYRQLGHMVGDTEPYRSRDEVEQWKRDRDPIQLLRQKLLASGEVTEQEVVAVHDAVDEIIRTAVAFAKDSPEPGLAELEEDVWV